MSEMIMFNKKSFTMIGKMAQQIKVLTIKPEKQSSTPQTHVVKGQNRLPQVVPWTAQGKQGECPHNTHL